MNSSHDPPPAGAPNSVKLTTAVQYLRFVGPARAKMLERLDLRVARDLLFHFPRDYQDLSELRTIEMLRDGQPASVCGVVEEMELRNTGVGRSMLGVLVRQGTQYLRALWFNQPFMQDKFAVGRRVMLSGPARQKGFRWEMVHPRVELLGDDEHPAAGVIQPIYSLTDGISQPAMRRIVAAAAEACADQVDEVFSAGLLAELRLLPIDQAIREIHTPTSRAQLELARRRFIYQELLVLQLALAFRRHRQHGERTAHPLPCSAKIDARITRLFPFELTRDQRRAIVEIVGDMAADRPMNRLLQGEVGSGKTVVAEYAMLLTVANGYQAVLMAPTEVLARQHLRTLATNLQQSRVRLTLLTGTLTAAERQTALAAIAAGDVDLIVGTHAVVGPDVLFHRLGLVIIDEQHKFGVAQRAALRQAGVDPHYLVMTATPIPRTVTMTLFGDLDVSTLAELPPGRQQVRTYLADPSQRARWWDFFRRKLREGRQGYVVAPLVEDSETVAAASVTALYEQLTNGELEEFRLDVLHGRQTAAEKEAVMAAFRDGRTQVLVATTVVEVGVDVGNATLMTIEAGERFGLAQLHQLRGRVSRGVHPGFVCIFSQSNSPEATARLQEFCRTHDGFELSELDFRYRGPGDLFGTRQHGLPPFRIADLQRDEAVLRQARADAQRLIESDPRLESAECARLKRMMLARYGHALEIGDVG